MTNITPVDDFTLLQSLTGKRRNIFNRKEEYSIILFIQFVYAHIEQYQNYFIVNYL